jgi:predicted unusual protein kinase regulating ubiquinone biosynthesis (AarF/ABC1/UbiB family)
MQVKSDWVAIIDKWAEAFFAEMDYSLEAANARRWGSRRRCLSPLVASKGSAAAL